MRNKKINFLEALMLAAVMLLCIKSPRVYAEEMAKSRYEFHAKFDEESKTLSVNQVVEFKNNYEDELTELVFHLYADSYNSLETMPAFGGGIYEGKPELKEEQRGDIYVKQVETAGSKAEFTQDHQILKITLENPVKPKEQIKITIDFDLKIPMGTSRLGYFEQVYSLTNWYPILSIYDPKSDKWDENPFHPVGESNYSETADYLLHLEVPSDMVVAATGTNVDEAVSSSEDDEKENNIIKVKAEGVRDFVFIMSPRFKVLTKEADGIKVNSYYLDKDKLTAEKEAEQVLNISAEAVTFFGSSFGRYPYEELDLVETYLSGGAMEYPQLIQMPVYPQFSDDITGGPISFIYEAAVHEVGHQWWYVAVGNNEFKESVLDESLTVFSTAYFFENKNGKYSENGVYAAIRGRAYPGEYIAINTPVDEFNNMGEYVNTIYGRGPMIFEDLRQRVGEDKFKEIMQSYYEKYKFKNANTKAFLEIVEQKSGEDIAGIIDEAMNLPNYYPENIQLKDEDHREIYKYQSRRYLEEAQKKYGTILGSVVLKAMDGEKVYIVYPASWNNAGDSVNNYAEIIKTNLDAQYGTDLMIKTDKELTDEDKQSGNLIILGNAQNNSLLADANTKLPVTMTPWGIFFDGIAIIDKEISGIFAAKSPYNDDKVVLVYYLNGATDTDMYYYGMESSQQFIFKVGNKKELRGTFEY